jgi:hypothetical protein
MILFDHCSGISTIAAWCASMPRLRSEFHALLDAKRHSHQRDADRCPPLRATRFAEKGLGRCYIPLRTQSEIDGVAGTIVYQARSSRPCWGRPIPCLALLIGTLAPFPNRHDQTTNHDEDPASPYGFTG